MLWPQVKDNTSHQKRFICDCRRVQSHGHWKTGKFCKGENLKNKAFTVLPPLHYSAVVSCHPWWLLHAVLKLSPLVQDLLLVAIVIPSDIVIVSILFAQYPSCYTMIGLSKALKKQKQIFIALHYNSHNK